MNCLECGKRLIKQQKKFCSRKCVNKYRNPASNFGAWAIKSHKIPNWLKAKWNRKGNKNPNWKGGHSYGLWHNRTWEKVKEYKIPLVCEFCKTTEKINIHHVDGNRENLKKENLMPLCHSHHLSVRQNKRYKMCKTKQDLIKVYSILLQIEKLDKFFKIQK